MDLVLSWVKGVFILSILSDIAIHLAPAEKYEKYIKYICGIGLLVVCINPLVYMVNMFSGQSGSVSFEKIYKNIVCGQSVKSLQNELKYDDFSNDDNILYEIKNKILEDIKNRAEEDGFNVIKNEINLENDKNNADYGKVVYINMIVNGKNNSLQKSMGDLKKELSEYYGLDEEKIIIKLR